MYYVYRNTNTGKYKINEEEATPPPPTKPGSVHRRVPADQAIPTEHLLRIPVFWEILDFGNVFCYVGLVVY